MQSTVDHHMEGERLEITLSEELLKKMDEIIELLGFGSREELVEAAVRRFVDMYRCIVKSPA